MDLSELNTTLGLTQEELDQMLTKQREYEQRKTNIIAAHNAELEAKAAAQEAAARQEQKDIIKEAILEALAEYHRPRFISTSTVDEYRLRHTL